MELGSFIEAKTTELMNEYSSVEFDSAESVVLSKNSVGSEFNSKDTPLLQKGVQVSLNELTQVTTLPFMPNGSVVKFLVKPPRKRKAVIKEYYFLWAE